MLQCTKSRTAELPGYPGSRTRTGAKKIDIIHHCRNVFGPLAINCGMKWPQSILWTFLKAYEKHGKLFLCRRMTAAPPLATHMVSTVMDELEANCRLSDRQQTLALDHAVRMNRTVSEVTCGRSIIRNCNCLVQVVSNGYRQLWYLFLTKSAAWLTLSAALVRPDHVTAISIAAALHSVKIWVHSRSYFWDVSEIGSASFKARRLCLTFYDGRVNWAQGIKRLTETSYFIILS
jgi:hypothetical protein